MCKGKVWLTGAGPGAGDLLTVKARRLLEEGDCIVFDRLVGAEVLSLIPPGREMIDVGKTAGRHPVPQEEINRILVEKARLGKQVVRLKGGDPFLFGRGGEEAEALAEAGVPFEVVPGISSCLAVPAYNGIPVTHRDYVSDVHVITGHHRARGDETIPYEALAACGGTLVFLMGVGALEQIMEGLRRAGMEETMPAAVLQQGTMAGQRRIVATIGTLAQKAREQAIKAPSVIVVGKVCAMAERLSWYESMPLFGEKIIVTRPAERGCRLQQLLRELGAEVVSVPAIQTVPVSGKQQLEDIRKELGRLDQYDVLVFTSPYGVRRFFALLMEEGKDARALSHMKFGVIGRGSGEALRENGIAADYMPSQYDGESLGVLLLDRLENGTRILLPRSSAGGQELLQELSKNPTLMYRDLPIYDLAFPTEQEAFLQTVMKAGDVTAVVFTSSSTVEGFCRMMGEVPFDGVKAVCIGKKTEAAARARGMKTVTAKNATPEELADLLKHL